MYILKKNYSPYYAMQFFRLEIQMKYWLPQSRYSHF